LAGDYDLRQFAVLTAEYEDAMNEEKWKDAATVLAKPMFYHRDGSAIDNVLEWAKEFEKNRSVLHDKSIWGDEISTVFLGLDHNLSLTGPPLVYETMVFCKASRKYLEKQTIKIDRRGPDCFCERTSSEAEARHAHEHARAQCRLPLWLRKRIFSGWY
jgi:hypothetical protein